MNPLLDGKVAVVTGAASGIGLATVERFVEEGARVLAADFREETGRALAELALLLRAIAAGASYAVPHMKRRGGGAIVNTSSISALQAGYAPLAYSVAKAGVLHQHRELRARLGRGERGEARARGHEGPHDRRAQAAGATGDHYSVSLETP
jgi:NAD(P)-dependent dehydrogenase (short-subunit alcohol dehydrogenase family)